MVTIKEITENFREMLQKHLTRQKGMLAKHEKSVLDLVSGHQALLKQNLDQHCDSLTSEKQTLKNLKKALVST